MSKADAFLAKLLVILAVLSAIFAGLWAWSLRQEIRERGVQHHRGVIDITAPNTDIPKEYQ